VLRLLFHLVYIDLSGFMRTVRAKIADTVLLQASRALVYGFLLPAIGAPQSYIGIYFAGAVFGAGLFDFSDTVASLVSDIEHDGAVKFELLLPFSQRFIYFKSICSHLFRAVVASLCALVIGKFLLWDSWSLVDISLWRVLIALVAGHFFVGTFALFCATFVTDLFDITVFRRAFLMPLYFMGGHLFPWRVVVSVSPFVSYLLLFNPIMHATEVVRASLLGQEGFLSFWPSIAALFLFSWPCFWLGWCNFARRLDLLHGYSARGEP
jgi:ABC-type polysaccharide/polyol phosphate export permease